MDDRYRCYHICICKHGTEWLRKEILILYIPAEETSAVTATKRETKVDPNPKPKSPIHAMPVMNGTLDTIQQLIIIIDPV